MPAQDRGQTSSSRCDRNVVIFFSNPQDTPRLRLDREVKLLEAVAAQNSLDPNTITFKHASTIDDVIAGLDQQRIAIVQFSGHGNVDGFVLEQASSEQSSVLSAAQLCSLLERVNTRAIVLLSCYSHSALTDLISAAPYIITVEGEALDSTAIEFCAAFYNGFFKTNSIETAFSDAQRVIYAKGGIISTVLSRRAHETRGGKVLYQIFPQNRSDSVLVDITNAEADFVRVGVSKDDFVKALAKKMRIHKWLFVHEKHRAIIPIGPYFGVFSWKDAKDVVTCHGVLKVRSTISLDATMAWASLIVTYNDLFVHRYRLTERYQPNHGAILKQALAAFHALYGAFFCEDQRASALKELDPSGFQITKAMIKAHLDMGDDKWAQKDHDLTVVYLETTLTTLHEYVTSLVKLVTE